MKLLMLLLTPSAHAFDPTPVTVLEGAPFRLYGDGAAFAGDVDGDGYDDMLVGRYGVVEFYFGGPGGPAATPDLELPGASSFVGDHVAGIGDVNGDGFDDVAIAYTSTLLGPDEIDVYYGSLFGLASTPDLVLASDVGDRFGEALAHGDLDGDGYDDLVVGSPGAGRVDVFLGGAAGLSAVAAESDFSRTDGHGRDLAVGDADGDGHLDILVSNEQETRGAELLLGDGSGTSFGAVFLLSDGAVGFFDHDGDGVDTPVTASGGEVRLHLGASPFFSSTQTVLADASWEAVEISEPGDVNGDGYDDVVVAASYSRAVLLGAPGGTPGVVTVTGSSYSFPYFEDRASLGDANGDGRADLMTQSIFNHEASLVLDPLLLPASHTWTSVNVGVGAFGEGMLDLGDVDGDGYDDVAFGCEGWSTTCVHRGGLGGLSASPALTLSSGRLRAAGDINGDGYGDLVLAASEEVHVHLGGPGGLGAAPDQVLPLPAIADLRTLDLRHDLDGDGDPDLVLFAEADGKWAFATALSTPTGLGAPQVARVHPGTSSRRAAFLGLADVDGDGFPDLIAVTPDETELVWLRGSASGPGGAPLPMGLPVAELPTAMVSGDFDGDGFADLALTTPYGVAPSAVVPGSPFGPDVARMVVVEQRPLWAGDLDGDGLDDLVTGLAEAGAGDATGEAAIRYGRVGGLLPQEDELFIGRNGEGLGSNATALDLDGDGNEELVLGAQLWDGASGRVLVFDQ